MKGRTKGREMARPPKERSLPDWFSLAAYEAASDLDAADWFLNLRARSLARRDRKRGTQTVTKNFAWSFIAAAYGLDDHQADLAALISRGPILRRDSCIRDRPLAVVKLYFEDAMCRGIIDHGRFDRTSVYEPSVADFYIVESHLSEEDRAFGRYAYAGLTSEEWERLRFQNAPPKDIDGELVHPTFVGRHTCYGKPEWFFGPVNERIQPGPLVAPLVRVDLSTPNDVLERDFKGWVRDARAKMKERRPDAAFFSGIEPANRRDLKSFAKCGLLPYLDLNFWRSESPDSSKLSDERLAEALEVSVENMRKTTAVWAKRLMRPFFLEGYFRRLLTSDAATK